MNERTVDLLRRAAVLKRDDRAVVACLLVEARGSTPQSPGALMLVDDAANTYGTIGGGCVEAEVRRRAFEMHGRGETGVLRFKLDHDYGWDDGLICGGSIGLALAPLPEPAELDRIVDAIERRRETSLDLRVDGEEGELIYTLRLPPRDRLYIAGAGHIGQAVARLALRLEFEVAIFDDRHDLLERFAPEGAAKTDGDIARALRRAAIDEATYCLVVTRGHRHDEQALEAVVGRGARYVGMIGSRRKVKLVFDDLVERGVDPRHLESVRAPVGLDIGSVTVEEIALSIAAQLVQVRRQERTAVIDGPRPAAVKHPPAAVPG